MVCKSIIQKICFLSSHSKQDIDKYKHEIGSKLNSLYIPYLDSISNLDRAISMILDRSYDNFINEYDRFIFLFSYVCAYNASNIVDSIVESFDPHRKSKNQQIPYHKQQLNMLKADVPEIKMIDV